MSERAYIELKGICKSFGSVQANKNVDFSLKKGEIHALLGENGSGKSTLVNMLSGIYVPDSGFIFMNGKEIRFDSPNDALRAGIGMVHQHFKLVNVMTAKDNIVLGQKQGFFLKRKQLTEELNAIADRYGLSLNPDKYIDEMSVSEQQTVEIMKMLYRGADVLILDEPTAVLTPQEIEKFFTILRNMRDQGCSIVIITHKMNEVLEISDRVTILRKGESVATVNTADTNAKALTEMMVGYSMDLSIKRTETPMELKKPLLSVEHLVIQGDNGAKIIDDMSFRLFSGEVLGVAGIAASGQKELCEAIVGLYHVTGGSVKLKDEELVGMSPVEIIRKGVSMSFVPEDRLGMGLVGSLDIVDNILLKTYRNHKGITVDRKSGEVAAKAIVEKFDISTPSVHHQVKKLSGGNIQKVLLGREIDSSPQVLITAYPARGLDIGAAYNIYNVINEQREKGVGVLYIGEDLDVILELCDRIMVMSHGRIMKIVDAQSVTKEDLGLMMLGGTVDGKEAHYA
ncbi:MAG TPA: ABC transporter ATP-binding protein [Firmicutes bacterium]|nr:ABC transporter ATP-binding protein [Bacillota bacterium]